MESKPSCAGAQVWFGREEVEVLNTCVSAKLRMDEDEEAVKMCEAFRLLIERSSGSGSKRSCRKGDKRGPSKKQRKKQKKAKGNQRTHAASQYKKYYAVICT